MAAFGPAPTSPGAPRVRAALLFAAICAGYLATLTERTYTSDGQEMLETAVSLHEFGELGIGGDFDPKPGATLAVERYAKYGLGFPLVLQVPLLAAGAVERAWGGGHSNVLFLLTNLLLTAGAALLVALVLLDLGARTRTASLGAVAFAFGTFAWPYISYDFSEPLQAICLVLGFRLLVGATRSTPPPAVRLALAGFVLGFAVLTKAFLAVVLPAYGLYLWLRLASPPSARLRALAWFAAPLAGWGVALAVLNWRRFGSVVDFGYGAEASSFTTPLVTGLYGLLLGPNRGLVFYAPLAVLVPWSLWRLAARRRPEAVFLASSFLLLVIPTALWWSWEGGSSWGPRLLLPILPLIAVSAALLLDIVPRAIVPFALLVVLGCAVNASGVLVSFVAWNNVLGLSPRGVPLELTGRPAAEYVEENGARLFHPYVAANYVAALSPIRGNAWVLGLRWFDRPFALAALEDPAAPPLPTVQVPPIELRCSLLQQSSPAVENMLWYLRSAHFWLWDTVRGRKREPAFSHPVYALALLKQGNRAAGRGNPARALWCYRRMAELMPENGRASLRLAQYETQQGMTAEARETLDRFAERQPRDPAVRLELARLCDAGGDRRRALEEYRAYLALEPRAANRPAVEARIALLAAAP